MRAVRQQGMGIRDIVSDLVPGLRFGPGCAKALMVCALQLAAPEAALSSSTPVSSATAQSSLTYWTFDPIVVSSSGERSVSLSIQTDNSTPRINLVLADGTARPMADQGGGRFTITLTHDEALNGDWQTYVNRNHVGYLDFNNGHTQPISINIDDGSIPEVAVVDLGEATRISPRIVNFHIPHQHPAQLSAQQITRRFYGYFADEFDFITIISTKAEPGDPYFVNVKNSTRGLGLELFDNSAAYGSSGRLEGVVRLPNFLHFDLAGREYLRMLGYNWMNYSQHSAVSRSEPDWPISSLANGIMGYRDRTSGEWRGFPFTFEPYLVGFPPGTWEGDYFLRPQLETPVYNSMEQYLFGLVPASSVSTFQILQNQAEEICALCVVQGPLLPYDVNSLQSLHGPRDPDASVARKDFRVATIVVSSDRLLSPQEIRHFDHMAARGEASQELRYSRDDVTGLTNPFRVANNGNGSLEALVASDLVDNINVGVSGAWFDPDLPGQGFLIDVLPESRRVFVGWFTFHTYRQDPIESRMGDPYHRWMTAVGQYSPTRAELTLYRTNGGIFNSNTPTENVEVGKMVFTLKDCEHAEIEYDVYALWQGQVSVERVANDNVAWCNELQPVAAVSSIDEPSLASNRVAPSNTPEKSNQRDDLIHVGTEPFQITAALNGAWYNPDWPGQGFFIDVLPDEQRLFTSWFTFDTERLSETGPKYSLGDRNQRWLTAQGNFQGNQAQLELTLTSGGQFMSDYVPVTNEHYGFLDLEFSDCETATARYEIPDLGISGEIPLKRISNENTPACELMGSAQGVR